MAYLANRKCPRKQEDSIGRRGECQAISSRTSRSSHYLGAIQEAGFQETRVIDEVAFPAELVANEPTIREIKIMKNLNISREKARELARSVVSIKVSAVKPAA